MIDHLFGRPSTTVRKYQVLAVVSAWIFYLLKGDRHGPPIGRRLSSGLSRWMTPWRTLVTTLLWLYVSRNFGKLVGLECPEPLANLYTPGYFRATWVLAALDAGFWSAMRIKRRWARNICSILFSAYYLICAEQADEKVRKVRAVITLEHLRVSWNKSTTPYLAFISKLLRPRLMRYQPRAIRIPRPSKSSYSEPVHGWLYFDGPLAALGRQKRVVLYIPGGGFVAMDPRTNDDALFAWAGKTGLPVLGLDYKKAPEYPYPYALNECYDVYHTIIASRGRCLGLSGEVVPQIVISGDSAGGNLATGTVLMILQSTSAPDNRLGQSQTGLPLPTGLVLSYPALDVNIGNWMTDEQMGLIRDRGMRRTNKRVLRRKNSTFDALTPGASPYASDDEEASPPSNEGPAINGHSEKSMQRHGDEPSSSPNPLAKTRLATPSMISYVNDRVLTPEMMRAMIILYVGPHSRPDFSTEYLLSPVLAPEQLLARFPKTYFITGERDPLVDDTVIMAGRIRAAKRARWNERRELGTLTKREKKRGWHESDFVEVCLIEGISHAFIQIAQLYPEAWKYIHKMGSWYLDAFNSADAARQSHVQETALASLLREKQKILDGQRSDNHLIPPSFQNHRRTPTAGSLDEDNPLEIGSARKKTQNHSTHPHLDPQDYDSGISGLDSQSDQPGSPRSPVTPAAGGLARDHPLHSRTSIGNLGSEEDLLARRMRGLVGSLTGREGHSSEEDV